MKNTETKTPPSPNGAGPQSADPYAPEEHLIDEMADFDAEKVLTTIPVRKPNKTEFFRVHPDPVYVTDKYLLEHDTGMEKVCYLVAPNVRHLVSSELRAVRLFTVVTKNGTPLLWPVKLSVGGSGGANEGLRRSSASQLQIADKAKLMWVKLVWNRNVGAFDMWQAKGDFGEPEWPEKSLRDLLEIAFHDHLIDREDHPVIRELYGEI